MISALQAGDPPMIGPYRLVGRLGSGGMGDVFLGVSAGGRPVAVKAIRPDLASDPDFRSRFGQEVAAARRVNGMFTAMVVDADSDGPDPWLATAYVPGPSLAEALGEHGPLPANPLLTLAAGLAESLSAIHAAGVVHRDLKPSNVLLAQDGPRVIDFGISRAVESTQLTQAGLVIGSPGFMSPEQAEGLEVGPPSDIFSLGAVLTYAACGVGPFGTGTTAAMLYRVVHGDPDLTRVPPEVRPLVGRCLAKDPGQRPTAYGLLAEVAALQPSGDWLPDSIVRVMGHGSGAASAPEAAGAVLLGEAVAPVAVTSTSATTGGQRPAAYPVPAPRPPAGAYPVPAPPLTAPPGGGRPRRRPWVPLAAAFFGAAVVVGGAGGIYLAGHSAKTPVQTSAAASSSPTAGSSARGQASRPSAAASAPGITPLVPGTSPLTGYTSTAGATGGGSPSSPSTATSTSPAPTRTGGKPNPTTTSPAPGTSTTSPAPNPTSTSPVPNPTSTSPDPDPDPTSTSPAPDPDPDPTTTTPAPTGSTSAPATKAPA